MVVAAVRYEEVQAESAVLDSQLEELRQLVDHLNECHTRLASDAEPRSARVASADISRKEAMEKATRCEEARRHLAVARQEFDHAKNTKVRCSAGCAGLGHCCEGLRVTGRCTRCMQVLLEQSFAALNSRLAKFVVRIGAC